MNKSSLIVILLVALVLGLASGGSAQGASGSQILAKVDQTMRSNSKVMQEEMTITNSSGQQRVRELQVRNKRRGEDDQMLVQFLYPADVKGSGVLISGDDMWLYLPALGKVRRIAGHAKKGSFMGSDFSYEDMEAFGSTGFGQDFAPEFIRDETVAGEKAYLLKLTPTNDEVSYEELQMWVSAETYLPRKIEYFKDGEMVKRLTTSDIAKIDDRWVAGTIQMEDISEGSKTTLKVKNVNFDANLDDAIFSTRYLERGL